MRILISCAVVVLATVGIPSIESGQSLSALAPPAGPGWTVIPSAQATSKVTVPAGTRILIRMTDSVDSTKQKTGERFTASLETNLQADDMVVAPRGATIYGRLIEASSAGRMSGSSQLTLELTDIVIGGTAYPLVTVLMRSRARERAPKPRRRCLVARDWVPSLAG
jgi:hypothetical protein